MRKKGIIVTGLGFGDEGKGATVDYLCSKYPIDCVIKYCGGCQCGHNVIWPSGENHVFSQFGSGTFYGIPTYIDKNVIFNPNSFAIERDLLKEKGILDPVSLVTIHPNCLVSTLYHRIMNRIIERYTNHGSCGAGVGDTRSYWLQYGQDAITIEDIFTNRNNLERKLELLRQRCLLKVQKYLHIAPNIELELLTHSPKDIINNLRDDCSYIKILTKPQTNFPIFEGAQGLLLDEYHGFHPNTTWSTVTPRFAIELADELNIDDTIILGVIRSYYTRHGSGPFPSYSHELTSAYQENNNLTDEWQKQFRVGYFDINLFKYACNIVKPDFLVINHLDKFPGKVFASKFIPNNSTTIPSLSYQEDIGKQLSEIQSQPFNLTHYNEDEFLDTLIKIASLGILARGPTSNERIEIANIIN